MRFEWDARKNRVNKQKHGLDFVDAWSIFNSPMLYTLDEREDYGEERWLGIGVLKTLIVVVVFTEPEEDVTRIISLRKANPDECAEYEEFCRYGLGTG